MSNLALIQSEVMDIITGWGTPLVHKPIEMDKLEFGQYGNHKKNRPYNTLLQGVNWYLNQPNIEHIPEELVLACFAWNFDLSMNDAVEQISKTTELGQGIVDLS